MEYTIATGKAISLPYLNLYLYKSDDVVIIII